MFIPLHKNLALGSRGSRCIGFLSFNKPVGLTLLKKSNYLEPLLPSFIPKKLAFKDVQFNTLSIV